MQTRIGTVARSTRRTHSKAFTQSEISACCEPAVSVTGVALANGLNANQVRRWMRERGVELPNRRRSEAVAVSDVAEPMGRPVVACPPA